DAAAGVGREAALLAGEWQLDVRGPVASGDAPHVGPEVEPAPRVLDRPRALRQRRPPRVLEVVDALAAHEGVADAAEVDPEVAVLVAEERREEQVLVALERVPLVG